MKSPFPLLLPLLRHVLLVAVLVVSSGLLACDRMGGDIAEGASDDELVIPLPPPVERDWDAIAERDTLRVLTTYNGTSYFLYRGAPVGYEYDLLKRFARDHDVVLQMKVVKNRDSLYHYLNLGVGDVVADQIVPLAADSNDVRFTSSLYDTRPVLVQQQTTLAERERSPRLDDVMERFELTQPNLASPFPTIEARVRLVRSPEDLAGQSVVLRQRSPYRQTLVELRDSIDGDIEVVVMEEALSNEMLMRQVSRGEIDYTVAPENVAELTSSYYANLRIRPALDEPYDVAWAVRDNAMNLQQKLNAWLQKPAQQTLLSALYTKYYIDRKGYRERVTSEYLTAETGRLSAYDDLLRDASSTIGWDWRLLAAQTYQESRFRPHVTSWAGAGGLLQLMPRTARAFGVTDRYDPEDNVYGAVRFLQWLINYWTPRIEDPAERLKFILASYNAGQGHVGDARRLAEKYGDNPDRWSDVAYWLLQKSKRSMYTDPVVRYGFCRGLEPVTYVAHILDRYDHYKAFVIQEAAETEAEIAA